VRPQPIVLEPRDARLDLSAAAQHLLQPLALRRFVGLRLREPRLGLRVLAAQRLELGLDRADALLERASGASA
jgi:hypothetical protein